MTDQAASLAPPPDLEAHLFRREWGRMVAALTRIFGVHNLALAEDVVQDAFCRARNDAERRFIEKRPRGCAEA